MKYKIQPWAHQLEAIERARTMASFALFFEMGAGKTGTVINILREKCNAQKRLLRTLIFCPPIVCKNWCDEWKKHSSVTRDKLVLLQGSGKERLADFAYHCGSEGKIVVTNYESLLMPELFQAFVQWAPEALVFDESHRLKNSTSKRSKLADRLANPLSGTKPFKYILSGSPVLNTPMDIFMQFKILDGGRTFGDNFFAFRARYFYDKNAKWRNSASRKYFPDWQILPGSLEEINKRLSTIAVRKTKEECLDLPPLVQQTIKVGMTPEQARVYKELAKEYISFIGDKAVSATLAIVKALRLMQIASGFVSLDGQGEENDPVQKDFPDNPKISALRELLEEICPTQKAIVWAVWRTNYTAIKRVCDELGLRYVEVHGGVSETKKREAVDLFNTDDTVRVFIGHPGSGGIGINLRAPYSIFYSRTFSLEHSLQAESRNHRGDSKAWGFDKMTRYDLVCQDTIDEEVVSRLIAKEEISEKTLRLVKEKILHK